MADVYRIHGIELSPYSVKVRSYFRYKGLPHRWVPRSLDAEGEYQKYVKLPLVPLVVTPDNKGIQDSTPIIEYVEAANPKPSIHPNDPVASFISVLLEEFGDEWGNKWMFHYRWAREADQLSAAGRIARSMMPAADDAQMDKNIAMVRERMVNRVGFVGSNPQTAPQIEQSFRDTLAIAFSFATVHGMKSLPTCRSSRGVSVEARLDHDSNSPSARGHSIRWIHANRLGEVALMIAPGVGSVQAL